LKDHWRKTSGIRKRLGANNESITSMSALALARVYLLVDGLVVVARLIRNALALGIHIHACIPSTMTRPSIRAVEDVLYGQVGVWPCSLLKEDVRPVSQCTGGSMSPAAPTAKEFIVK
jgi:hypothetical protein